MLTVEDRVDLQTKKMEKQAIVMVLSGSKKTAGIAVASLEPKHFTKPLEAAIFDIACRARGEGPVDITMLSAEVHRGEVHGSPLGRNEANSELFTFLYDLSFAHEELKEGEPNHIGIPDDALVEAHLNNMVDAWSGRHGRLAGHRLADTYETDEQLRLLSSTQKAIAEAHSDTGIRGADDLLIDLYEQFYEDIERKEEHGFFGVPMGYDQLDAETSGMQPGGLYIVGARPGTGKTALALNMMLNQINPSGEQIAVPYFHSGELTQNKVMQRLVSNYAGFNMTRFQKADSTRHYKDQFSEAIETFRQSGARFYVRAKRGQSPEQVARGIRVAHLRHGIGIAYVDYITALNIETLRGEQRTRAVGRAALMFRELAQELQIPIVLISQLNREGGAGEPKVHMLKDSSELEQHADGVILLWCPREDDMLIPPNLVEAIVPKWRDGNRCKVAMKWEGVYQRFEEWPPDVPTREQERER